MQPFSAVRIIRTATIRLSAPPDRVFPLFGPIDEQRWEASWHPTMLYPPSGATQRDAVFTAEHADGTPSFWTIVAFEPDTFWIAYVRLHPATHIARIDIGCAGDAGGTTRAEVTYTFTGLTALGNTYVETFTEPHYATWLKAWEVAINRYLTRAESSGHDLHA
jgi:hypothetical protein